MTEVKKRVTEEQTVYISKDGQEFPTSQLCVQHEKELSKSAAILRVSGLKQFTNCPPFELDPGMDWKFFFVKSEKDISAIVETEMDIDAVADSWWKERPQFPCWICMICDGEYGLGVLYKFEDLAKSMTDYIGGVEEKMKDLTKGEGE